MTRDRVRVVDRQLDRGGPGPAQRGETRRATPALVMLSWLSLVGDRNRKYATWGSVSQYEVLRRPSTNVRRVHLVQAGVQLAGATVMSVFR